MNGWNCSDECVEGNWMRVWSYGTTAWLTCTFQCLLVSTWFWHSFQVIFSCRSCGLKLLYPVVDGIVIRNLYLPQSIEMAFECMFSCCQSLFLDTICTVNLAWTTEHWSMLLLNGIHECYGILSLNPFLNGPRVLHKPKWWMNAALLCI